METSPLKLIYDDDSSHYDGYIHIYSRVNNQMKLVRFCKRSEAAAVIEKLKIHNHFDYYITSNTTIADKRQKNYLLSYNNIVIDIDCHNGTIPADLREIAVDTLIDKIEGSDLPRPTVIHKTGRGVQLWYHIEQISSKLFFLYEKAIDLLCFSIEYIISENPTYCSCLSIDKGASRNSVGLFRLFGTFNTKTNNKTEYITTENTYTIHELITILQDSEDIPISDLEQPQRPMIHCIDCSFINLHKGRMNILKQLAGEQTGEGLRELILFLYYNSSFQVCEPAIAESLTRELNSSFFEPLSEKELKCIFCCIDKKHYKYKTKTFCEVLGITQDYYNRNSNPREEKRERNKMNKDKKKKLAEMMKNSGDYTNEEIAEITGFCIRTIEGIKSDRISIEEAKPWEQLGISRRTYYYKKRQGLI